MRKLLAIVWKDLYITFTDRIALVFMFAAPLVISLIMGAAFGSFFAGTDTPPALDIAVAVVNQDAGVLGQRFMQAYVLNPVEALDRVLDARVVDDWVEEADRQEEDAWEEAKRLVETGDVVAAVLVPEDFSTLALVGGEGAEPGTIEVYYNEGEAILGGVVRDIVKGFVNDASTRIITLSVGPPQAQSELFSRVMQEGYFAPPVTVREETAAGERQEINIISLFAPSMAIFFMTFAVTQGATDLLREKRQWTLHRLIVTPTPRVMILVGKVASTYATGVLQLLILWVATTAFGANWGADLVAVILLILAVVLAGCGLGTLISGLVTRPQQVDVYGTAILIGMGILGGSFTSPDFLGDLNFLSKLTLNYWGIKGFNELSLGGGLPDVVTHLAVLLLLGVVFFVIGMWRFNRHMDV